MESFYSEDSNPNILQMDFNKFLHIKLLLDNTAIREKFLEVLPKEIFSIDKYNLMETEGNRVNMSPGKWLLTYLGNIGGCVSDLICWFEQMNLDQALIHLKEEEPLQIIEQPKPSITVNEGEKFYITCKASGYPYPEYQWFKDNEELLLEQEEVISVPFAKKENSGTYICKISKHNADSSVESLFSDHVEVIVLPCKPSNSFVSSRQNSFEKQPLSTQLNNISIEADLENTQTKPKECFEQNILSTNCNEPDIVIVKQPRSYDEKLAQGSILWFKCKAKSSQPVKYQWYQNGRKLVGQTSTKLLVDELYPDQEGNIKFQFFCEVYNDYDQVISKVAHVELSESNDKTKYVAEEKIALLIANDKYAAYEENLVTPAVDVVDLAKLLESINFKVIVFRNLSLREMQSSFQAFCRFLKKDSYGTYQ